MAGLRALVAVRLFAAATVALVVSGVLLVDAARDTPTYAPEGVSDGATLGPNASPGSSWTDENVANGQPDMSNAALHEPVFGKESANDKGQTTEVTNGPDDSQDDGQWPTLPDTMRCVEQPYPDVGGSDINCQKTCEHVCRGRTFCPCNTKVGEEGCWVPKASAKRLCEGIKACTVISNFHQPLEADKGPIYDEIAKQWQCSCSHNQTAGFLMGWSHLGNTPLIKRRNFRAAVCDKPRAKGCYECESRAQRCNSTACEACFKVSHGLGWDADDYCEAAAIESPCSNCECCKFDKNKECARRAGRCEEPKPLCPASLAVAIRHVPTTPPPESSLPLQSPQVTCEAYIGKVLMRLPKGPSIAEACSCLDQVDPMAPVFRSFDFDCRLTRAERTLEDLKVICNQPACTQHDQCGSCVSYRSRQADGGYRLLRDINLLPKSYSCEVHPETKQCVRLGGSRGAGSVLDEYEVCSAYIGGPPPSVEGRGGTGDESLETPTPTPTPTRELYSDDSHRRGPPVSIVGARGAPSKADDAIRPRGTAYEDPRVNRTDPENTVLGNAIIKRQYLDQYAPEAPLFVAMLGTVVPDDGTIDEWSLYAGRTGTVTAQVLRPVTAPVDLESNPEHVEVYQVVGFNELVVTETGSHSFYVRPSERIQVHKGDILGFSGGSPNGAGVVGTGAAAAAAARRAANATATISPNSTVRLAPASAPKTYTGIVAWSPGGSRVLFRYGRPSQPTRGEPNHVEYGYVDPLYQSPPNTELFVGDGTLRSYSLAAKGRFLGSSDMLVTVGSDTFESHSASHSISLSPSPSPSYMHARTELCDLGAEYWCAGREQAEACGIPEGDWISACAPQPSPAPRFCDPLMRCPKGKRPVPFDDVPECFVASRDCVECKTNCNEAFRTLNTATFGASASGPTATPPRVVSEGAASSVEGMVRAGGSVGDVCPYCQAGGDWTGLCAKGKAQSPIKITWADVDTDERAIMFFSPEYKTSNASLEHVSTALRLVGDFGELNLEGTIYDATAVVVHAPAEHQVEGTRRAAAELQIVHKQRFSDTGELGTLIVSVLLDGGGTEGVDDVDDESNQEVAKLLPRDIPRSPDAGMRQVKNFDLARVVSENKAVAFYVGSLTVPPCTEGVRWAVQMGQNTKLTAKQVDILESLFKSNPTFAGGRGNNRAVQDSNARRITLKHNCGAPGAIACPL